jgi:HEAT repeat protein
MSKERAQKLIERLKNYRTRKAAADALIAMDEDAVRPLTEALQKEELEDAHWTIVNVLGEIGSTAAIPAISQVLEEQDYQSVAHDALVKIAGRDLGPMARDWMNWFQQEGAGGPSNVAVNVENPELMSNDNLVALAVEPTGGEWREEAQDRFAVDLPVESAGGGSEVNRRVAVLFGNTDSEGSEIVVIYTTVGEAKAEHYETVLRNNLRMPYGAMALRDIGGVPHFVMFNAVLRHGLTAVELRKSITTVGNRAEAAEHQLG